jgi:hypothetical protein
MHKLFRPALSWPVSLDSTRAPAIMRMEVFHCDANLRPLTRTTFVSLVRLYTAAERQAAKEIRQREEEQRRTEQEVRECLCGKENRIVASNH